MKLMYYAILVILLSIPFACKKDVANETPAPPVEAVKRSKGNPLGEPVSKMIDAAGGMLEAADKRMKVIIPPGAVTEATNFSIQLVQNTLTESSRPAFRLLPEGVEFKKPVTVEFSYKEKDLEGTAAGLLHLAYQDAEGIFYMVMETTRDENNQTLSTQTTHFSDWTFVEALKVEVDKPELNVGESANLKLMRYETLITPLVKDPPIGYYAEFYGPQSQLSKIKWSLAVGSGKITPAGIKCTYTAPATVPEVNPALISVTVPVWNDTKKDYSSQGIITVPITIVEDEYFVYTLDGVAHVNNRGDCATPNCISMEADNFYVAAQMKSNQYILIRLLGDEFGTKSYPYGLEDEQAYIMLTTDDEFDWMSSYYPCEHCEEAHSQGSVKLTKYEAVGGYVEGSFTGEVWYQDGSYNPPKKAIAGKFRVKRTI